MIRESLKENDGAPAPPFTVHSPDGGEAEFDTLEAAGRSIMYLPDFHEFTIVDANNQEVSYNAEEASPSPGSAYSGLTPAQAASAQRLARFLEEGQQQMKITKTKLKQLIKEELAEMQMTDIDPDTLSDEDILGTAAPDDIANDSPEAHHLSDQKVMQELETMTAKDLYKVLAKLDQENTFPCS